MAMSEVNYFRYAIFGWFIYLLIKGCCERQNNNDENTEAQWRTARIREANAGGHAENTESSAEGRKKLVRDCLEFRTVAAPKPPPSQTKSGNTDQKKEATKETETSDLDLEIGEGQPPSSPSTAKNATNRDNAGHAEPSDNSNNSNNNNNNGSVRSLISNIFQRRSTTDLDTTNTSNNNNEDDDSPIASNESQFSINSLFQSFGLSGPDTRNHECCSICLENFKVDDKVARMKRPENYNPSEDEPISNHWFHEDCITEWLQYHDDCPLSRIKIVKT